VSFSFCSKASLEPKGSRSPLRYGRCRTDVHRTSCTPFSASKKFKSLKTFEFLFCGENYEVDINGEGRDSSVGIRNGYMSIDVVIPICLSLYRGCILIFVRL
jgi:hypothetical protein